MSSDFFKSQHRISVSCGSVITLYFQIAHGIFLNHTIKFFQNHTCYEHSSWSKSRQIRASGPEQWASVLVYWCVLQKYKNKMRVRF